MQVFACIRGAAALVIVGFPLIASAQARQPYNPPASGRARTNAGTLVIAGQEEQAPITRISGHPYVDIEALARITHATVRYVGNQIILTLPSATTEPTENATDNEKPPQLSGAFLSAEIEALTAIREWRVSLVNAVRYQYPIAENWIAPLQRSADAKMQLAAAAASTEPDQRTLELLRNEFNQLQQESDNLLAIRARVAEIRTDMFDNNPQDQKILTCERALAQIAASKQFQDDPSCH